MVDVAKYTSPMDPMGNATALRNLPPPFLAPLKAAGEPPCTVAAAQVATRGEQKMVKWGVSGRVCWYVACYDFVLGFNVSSLVLMIFQVEFWGSF